MLLDDVADLISTGGHGTFGVDLFKGMLPSAPDEAVAVIHYGGLEPVRAMAASAGQMLAEVERVQVLARAPRLDSALKRARDIFYALDGAARAVNGVQLRWVQALQSPFDLGPDAGGRSVVGCNYQVVRDAATSS